MSDGPLKLTPLGEFVYWHSVMTGIDWWRDIFTDAKSVVDEDGDLELFFQEKIMGLLEMRTRFYQLLDQEPS